MFSTNGRRLVAVLLALGLSSWATLAAASPGRLPRGSPPNEGRLIVHEWGTFLSVQGSDGGTLGGMVDSEERLPIFVRERRLDGRNRACMFLKMETPVTYFYVDRPRTVQVRVDMPQGLLTHWFPVVRGYGPPPQAKPATPAPGSFLDWGRVELLPDVRPHIVGPLPPLDGYRTVPPDNTWRFARETDAAFVRVGRSDPTVRHVRSHGDVEKFLFYRGLGMFELPLAVRSAGAGDDVQLTLQNRSKDALQGMFVVRVGKDSVQYAAVPVLAGGAATEGDTASLLTPPLPLKDGVPQVKQAVAASLIEAGLYAKEAQAMVNTWEHSYFRTPGLRVLYVLPRKAVDQTIPIQINPEPEQLVRVMVGRVEVLTPGLEKRLVRAVADLGARDAAVQKAAGAELAQLGRLQEPALHRVAALATVPEVRERAETLIKAAAGPGR
jgi:hypothetical protein